MRDPVTADIGLRKPKMERRSYDSRELLRYKHAPVRRELYDQLQGRLRRDQALGEILRIPLERPLPRIMEEPSEMSDTEGSGGISPAHKQAPASFSNRQLDGTGIEEWTYRGRDSTESVATQPISAPSDLTTQRHEGFQRFYKMVASPSHVRVTAGGRIVPNPRGSLSSSPTSTKWVRDRQLGNGQATTNNGTAANSLPTRETIFQGQNVIPPNFTLVPQPAMMPGIAPAMTPAMAPGIAPGIAPAMAPTMAPAMIPSTANGTGAYSVIPWHMGFNFGPGLPVPPHPLGQFQNFRPVQPNTSRSESQTEAGSSENQPLPQSTPPGQFDPRGPFFYGGQWMMPPGAPLYPFAMAPPPGLVPPPMIPPTVAAQRFGPTTIAPSLAQNGEQPSQPAAATLASQEVPSLPNMTSAQGPYTSSIRASAITRRQLDTLRNSLRWTEDQIQYNRHQIDERFMEFSAHSIRQSIQHFEKIEEMQLVYEEANFPRPNPNEDTSDSASQDEIRPRSPVTSSVNPGQSSESVSSEPDEASVVQVEKDKSRCEAEISHHPTETSTCGQGTSEFNRAATIIMASSGDSSARSSTLPVTAALAPPFQPRNMDGILESTMMKTLPAKAEAPPTTAGLNIRNSEGLVGEPYLVGHLPPGILPEVAEDADYSYSRELTEDELRARHMYWGKAPHHLQSGLPKFDGRDFYPPSPTSSGSTSTAPNSPLRKDERHLPHKQEDKGKEAAQHQETVRDPFQSAYKLGRQGLRNFTQPESSRIAKHLSQGHGSIQNRVKGGHQMVLQSESPNGASSSSSPDENDSRNLLFKGRNSLRARRVAAIKPRNGLFASIMNRAASGGSIVPGTVSSTTVQGVLPHYQGHATASLTPTATNTNVIPGSGTPRSKRVLDFGSQSPITERQSENRPLAVLKHIDGHRATSETANHPPKV